GRTVARSILARVRISPLWRGSDNVLRLSQGRFCSETLLSCRFCLEQTVERFGKLRRDDDVGRLLAEAIDTETDYELPVGIEAFDWTNAPPDDVLPWQSADQLVSAQADRFVIDDPALRKPAPRRAREGLASAETTPAVRRAERTAQRREAALFASKRRGTRWPVAACLRLPGPPSAMSERPSRDRS